MSAQAQREMQARIAGFDPVKHGYTELAEWNTKLEALCTELERTDEKWLELAERAWDRCVVCTVPARRSSLTCNSQRQQDIELCRPHACCLG